MKKQNEIIVFDNEEIKLEVNMKDETVWLTREQMSELFVIDRTGISRHINNIYKENELEKSGTCAKIAHMGNNELQTYETEYYSLDVIISVGYRVKSKNGIIFRKWANKILKEYMIKGYIVNEERLNYLEKTIKLIDIASRKVNNDNDESFGMIKVISEYTKALDILDKYDHQNLTIPNLGTDKYDKLIKYEDCIEIINKMCFKEDSNIFGLERDNGLDSIINNVYMQIEGKDVYLSLEEKACNFLYFVVKNHVFIDGNKRIAATLFLYFLSFYDILKKDNKNIIEPETLVALTLFIAQSKSNEKNIIIDLVMNILLNN